MFWASVTFIFTGGNDELETHMSNNWKGALLLVLTVNVWKFVIKNVIEFLVIIFISTNYPMMLSTM
jgi:hypothetical protein